MHREPGRNTVQNTAKYIYTILFRIPLRFHITQECALLHVKQEKETIKQAVQRNAIGIFYMGREGILYPSWEYNWLIALSNHNISESVTQMCSNTQQAFD